jgi:hypothetical protein
MAKKLPFFLLLIFTLFFSHIYAANVVPTAGLKYYILQTATKSGKVVGTTTFNESVIANPDNQSSQQFEFISVSGKTDTYYLKNAIGYYLINSADVLSLTEYADIASGSNSEWVLTGTSLASVRLKVNSSGYLATTDIAVGSYLYCDKTATDALGAFKLVPATSMVQNGLIDPGFENAVVEGTPIGTWVNNGDRILGNDDATTLNYRSRVVTNGYQSVDNNAFLLRFYNDANSYTKISNKLTGLTQGATYKFTFKYKQGNVNTTDATVSVYAANVANDLPTNALGTVFTTTAPTTTAATQTAQNGTVTFVAPASSCYMIFAKNPVSTSAFLSYIDDMVLTKTVDATRQIISTVTSLSFNASNRADTMLVTASLLTDSVYITAPVGITVTPKVLSPGAGGVPVVISSKGFNSVTGNITLTSGDVTKSIPVTATYNTAFINPLNGTKYYIQQRTGGKVLGKKAGTTTAALRYAEKDDNSQLFEFVPISGKANTFYIVSGENKYLSKVKTSSLSSSLEFTDNIVDNTQFPSYSEWVIQGSSDTLVYITQASDAVLNIGSDSIIDNKPLYNDRSSSAANSAFTLQKASNVVSTYMFDPSFENNPIDGGPLGTWLPSTDQIQLGLYGFSRVQGGNGWASTGKKCMYLRFMGDVSSYNSISQKLFSLTPGATYRLDLQYKCQSTSATSLVNIYAATTANAPKSAAIGGLYASTVVAASNLATQAPQSMSITFVAPAAPVYIVYSKNTAATNFNFFIDNLVLTETKVSGLNNVMDRSVFNAYVADNKFVVDVQQVSAGRVEFSISNMQGQILLKEKTILTAGLNHKEFNLSLPAGIYLVGMSNTNGSMTLKVIK